MPVVMMTLIQDDIVDISLPDGGEKLHDKRIPYYRSMLDLSNRQSIRFAVKAIKTVYLLFSERHANTINYNTDHDYIEVLFGSSQGSVIRVGIMAGWDGAVVIPDVLDASAFKYFWISWNNGVIKVGHGFGIGDDIIMEKSYPSSIDVKYLALWNGYGSGEVKWRLFTGVYY